MNKMSNSKIIRYATHSRWQFIGLVILVVILQQMVEHVWLVNLSRSEHFATQILFYGISVPVLLWRGLTLLRKSVSQTSESERKYLDTQTTLQEVNNQLTTLSQSNGRLAAAYDEESLLKVLLELPLDVVPALGTSLICFDQQQHPLPPLFFGDLPPSVFETLSTHLTEQQVRQQCASCTAHAATSTAPCPLFLSTTGLMDVQKIHCLELKCNGRLYAVLNIYLADSQSPTPDQRKLLDTMAGEMALALESYCLRRDLAILHDLEQLHQDTSDQGNLRQVLEDTVNAFEVAGGVLYVADKEKNEICVQAQAGQSLGADLDLITTKVSKVWQTETPLILYHFNQKNRRGVRSILAAPMQVNGCPFGMLVLWAPHTGVFTDYHVHTVAIIAAQAAQLAQNNQIHLRREYQVMLAERGRLAREIHDGLAQTLGYLKLRSAQIADWLQRGETQRTLDALGDIRQLLDCAYTDTREAIDGLRLNGIDRDVQSWVDEVVSKFETFSGIPVDTISFPDVPLPPEVQAQLQRIIQEAFSNVRRHADATRVWLEWSINENQLTLKIRDNGCGFDQNDMHPFAQHGLRIMEERAGLLDAMLQVVSYPDEGTEVVLKFPYLETAVGVEHERAY